MKIGTNLGEGEVETVICVFIMTSIISKMGLCLACATIGMEMIEKESFGLESSY